MFVGIKLFQTVCYTLAAITLMACNANTIQASFTKEIKAPKPVNTQPEKLKSKQFNDDHFKQQIINYITEMKSDSEQFSEDDLYLFAQQLGDARIVGLGEQTHGAGSVFTLKTQLIKYLHDKHDFDVFILESGMLDVQQIWQQAQQGQQIKTLAPGNIFYMYSKTDEVLPLFDYINEQALTEDPIILLGFDSQHTGEISKKSLVSALTEAIVNASKKTDL